jgi:predicted TIM-barrel fold metal-dependent hydrolase
MDAASVDRALAIPFPDHRAQHDLIGRAVQMHPDRLVRAACMFPLVQRQSFDDEIRRCREMYGFTALKLQPQYHTLNPLSASSDFFFEAAIENHMAVVCHTGSGMPLASPALLMRPARTFPDLTIVAAHSGGGIFVGEAIVAALYCPNIVLELSTLMPHHVLEVLSDVGSERLMIGSDLPESAETEVGKILSFAIPDEDKRNILD